MTDCQSRGYVHRHWPKKLTERHRTALWMRVRGFPSQVCCRSVGLSNNRFQTVAASPLGRAYFQAANAEWSRHRHRASLMLALGFGREEALEVLCGEPPAVTRAILRALADADPQTPGELLAVLDGIRGL